MIMPVDASKKLFCAVALLMVFMSSRVAAQPRPAEFRFHVGQGIFYDYELPEQISVGASYRYYFGEHGWAIEPEYSLMTEPGHQDHMLVLSVVKDFTPPSKRVVPYLSHGNGTLFPPWGVFAKSVVVEFWWGNGGQDVGE